MIPIDPSTVLGAPSPHSYFTPMGSVMVVPNDAGLRQYRDFIDSVVLPGDHGIIEPANAVFINHQQLGPPLLLEDGQELRLMRVSYLHQWPETTERSSEIHVVFQETTNPATRDSNVKIQVLVASGTTTIDLRARKDDGQSPNHPDAQALIDGLVFELHIRALRDILAHNHRVARRPVN